MTKVELERKFESSLFMTFRVEDSARSLLKVIGDSQVPQLLQIAQDLLPERALFPSADERNTVENDEFDFTQISDNLFRLILRNGVTSYDQFDFTLQDLREFVDALESVRTDDDFVEDVEIGPPITSAVAGPTGPTGAMGPTGPAGSSSDSKTITSFVDSDVEIDSAQLRDILNLEFVVSDGQRYAFDAVLFIESDNVNLVIKLDGPDDVDDIKANVRTDGTQVITSIDDEILASFSGSETVFAIEITGIIHVGNSSGKLSVQAALAGTDAIRILANSFISSRRIEPVGILGG